MCGQSKSVGVVDDENVYVQAAQRIEAQRAEPVPQAKSRSPFDAVDDAFPAISKAISAGDIQGARAIATEASKATLGAYYLGRGQFDHVRFLADLEREKGSPLNESELRLFGRAVGNFTGNALADEVQQGKISQSEGLLLALGVIA